jgi:hypothetical protein
MKCRICSKEVTKAFEAQVMFKYNVKYYHCQNCSFLQTEDPYWLEEAYQSPINLTDTGLVQRNIYLSKKIAVLLYFIFGPSGKFLDYAGGYGLFTRLMRDIGFDFYWHDPYTQNLLAKGFEYIQGEPIEAITTFETFEHLVTPMQDIEKMVNISPNIIFTTELLPDCLPNPTEWWYYGLDHGQHIAFYHIKTLKYIANYFNVNFVTNGRIHMFSKKKINKFYFKLISKASKIGLYNFVTRKMSSKTVDDMNKMKQMMALQ